MLRVSPISTPPPNYFHTYSPLAISYPMVPCRDIIVPNAVRGIVEVVATHTMTNDGTVRSSDKVMPIVVPKQTHSGQSSRTQKNKAGKANTRAQCEEVPGLAHAMGIRGDANRDADVNPCLDDWDDPFPNLDPVVDESQPRNSVCPNSTDIDTYTHI